MHTGLLTVDTRELSELRFTDVKADDDGRCWLFDKEERIRKAAAYFTRRRIADTAVEEQ
eukprot:COSAG02_NODE_14185_length_1299_cov_2.887500_2_plen_59_part_00